MAKFSVPVRVTKVLEKPMTIYAKDAEEAMRKAEELVGKWVDIEKVEAIGATPLQH